MGGWGAVRLPPVVFALYSKNLWQPISENSWLFPTFGCGYPYEFFFFKKLCLHPLTALLGHPVQTYFLIFCHLIKKSLGNPYLKMCDLTQYFFADNPMKKKEFKNLVLPSLTALLGHQVQNIFFCFNQKNLFTNPSWNNF